ncbi:MAG TPA: DUF3857 domain-containing protein, partial [Polyangiaceae bacterium]
MAHLGVWRWAIVLFVLLFSSPSPAETPSAPGVEIGATPSWVLPGLDVGSEPESSGGVSVLALDFQVRHVRGQSWRFRRSVIKVTNEAGTRVVGEQKFSFVPPFERLVFHKLEVQRGGVSHSQLKLDAIQVLRREARLESSVYDGTRTAVSVIPDVRVGDVVVCEYSIVGANPVLDDHYTSAMEQLFTVNVGSVRYRMTTDRELAWKLHAGATEIEHRTNGSLHEYSWQGHDLRAPRQEDNVPPEEDLAPWVAFTDYRSWSEVAEWGRKLFELPPAPSPAVAKVLREIKNDDPKASALSALGLAQDRVRYLSLALAESSHRPAAPDKVLERGFGDCKDKSLLLLALLRGLGIDAHAALVSSTGGDRLPRTLPTTALFDHVIVTAVIDGERYWLDPTRTQQRGRLSDVSVGNLRQALVLAPGTDSIMVIERPSDPRPDVRTFAKFVIRAFGGSARLALTTRYTRAYADAVRAVRAASSQQEFNERMRRDVVALYSKATSVGDATVEDDDRENELVVRQEFELKEEWSSAKTGQPALGIYPPWMTGRLPPAAPDRVAPLALEYPLSIEAQTEVELPVPIRLEPKDVEIRKGNLSFRSKRRVEGNHFSIAQSFETLAPVVPASDLPGYRRASTDTLAALDLAIASTPPATGTSRLIPF